MSIAFDRAVAFYDQTRAMPEPRHRAMIESLVHETGMKRDSTVLEIGIGTGRIALSVAEHFEQLYGIDLSLEMMGVLRRKLANTAVTVELAQANALFLPFPTGAFDVVYAVHVYHLVAGWQDALLDARRVLKPGGRLVVSFHKRDPQSPNSRLRKKMHELAHALGIDTRRPGAQSESEIYDVIAQWDTLPRIVVCSTWRDKEIPAKILEELDRQIYSETWMIPREAMDHITPQLRVWAEETFGSLSTPIETAYETRWLVATKPK